MSPRVFFYFFFAIYLTSHSVFFSLPAYAEEAETDSNEQDDDNDDEHPTQFIVKLSESAQTAAGLKTLVLTESRYQPEYIAYGQVLSVQPLLDLRKRYFLALSEQSSAEAKYTQAQQSIKRLQNLYKEQIVSKSRIQSEKSQWLTNKAEINAAYFQIKAIYDESLVHWGTKLTDLALSDNKKDVLTTFITGQQHLLEISVPTDKVLSDSIKQISISPDGKRQHAFTADYFSASPRSATINQGYSYYFVSDSPLLKSGMKLSAWLPEHHLDKQGVIIPKSALFWHMGQSFVYVKTEDDEFTRVAIPELITTPDGYFNQQQLKAEDELVIIGAQMLLSEEFRALIPDEDDDD